MTNEETVQHLNALIEVSRDGESGYLAAAGDVDNSELRGVFTEYAHERAGFIRELSSEVERLGGIPAVSGTVTAAVHRGWMDLKAAVTGRGTHAVVAACETGEDAATAAYERVVNLDISGAPRSLVEKQWHKIQEAHQRMLHLKEETVQ